VGNVIELQVSNNWFIISHARRGRCVQLIAVSLKIRNVLYQEWDVVRRVQPR
jgi:hypothetical protein